MGKTLVYRTVVCFIILLCFSATAYLQKSDSLTYSAKSAFDKQESKAITLHAGEQIILVKPHSRSSSIQFTIYDAHTMTQLDEFSWVSQNDDDRYFSVISVSYFQDQILILSGSLDRKEKTETLWLNTLTANGQEVSTIEVENREQSSFSNPTSYEIFKSDQEEFLGVSSVNESSNGNEFEISLYIYDRNLVKLSTQELNLPNIKKVSFPSSFTIDMEGTVYFLNGLTEKKGDEVDKIGLDKRLYQLFRYSPIDEKLKQYDVSIADKYISDVKMKTNAAGDLVVLGFYNSSYEKAAEGLFTMVIGKKEGAILLSGKKPFSLELISDFKTEKQAKKNPTINNLFLDHIFFNEKGNIILLAEVFLLEQRLMQNVTGMSMTTSTYFNYEEILALEIDTNLGYVQHHTIHKRQKSINFRNPYWSYSVLNPEQPEKLAVLYNYVTPKEKKNAVTLLSEARTSVWYQNVFSNEPKAIELDARLKVAPLFSPNQMNNTIILQDKNEFRVARVITSDQ